MLGIIGAAAEIRKINDPTSKLSKEQKQTRLREIADQYGFESPDEMQDVVNAARDANTMESRREMAKGAQKYGKIAEKKMEEFASLGVVGADGKLSKEFLKNLPSPEARQLAGAMVGAERAMAGGAFADTTDEGMAIASGAFSGAEEQYGRMDRFLATRLLLSSRRWRNRSGVPRAVLSVCGLCGAR